MLIQQYELNYTYSATLLLRKIKERRTKNNGLCLGFAPTYSENNPLEQHQELPWAQKELESVQQIFRGDYLFGADATKERFLEKAADYGILHLATHGIVDLKNSSKSRLAFAQSKLSTAREAAALYAFEIHNLSLNADLVVLSACETGFGRIVRGEGVLSMARAFLYAGSPSVVTTLWKVNDYTSATIMTYFYENLSRGMSKPAALKKAKMDYLRQADATAGHPAFWASYISIGNPEPITSGWRWWHGAILLGLLGLAGFGFWYKVYRPRRAKNKVVEQTVFNPDDPDQEAQFMGMGSDQDL
jgi:CHAT domain-containing protein